MPHFRGDISQYGRGQLRRGSGLVPLVTWTCVLGARRRCHPRGGDRDPASASSGPGSVLRRCEKEGLVVMRGERMSS